MRVEPQLGERRAGRRPRRPVRRVRAAVRGQGLERAAKRRKGKAYLFVALRGLIDIYTALGGGYMISRDSPGGCLSTAPNDYDQACSLSNLSLCYVVNAQAEWDSKSHNDK